MGHLSIQESPFNLINWAEANGAIPGTRTLQSILSKQDAKLLPTIIRQYYGRLKNKGDGYFLLTPEQVRDHTAVPGFWHKEGTHPVPMGMVKDVPAYHEYLAAYERVFLSLAETLEQKGNKAVFVG